MAPLTAEPLNEDRVEALNAEDAALMSHFSGATADTPRAVVVDLRELRSSLPFVLYKKSFKLEPITISVGDYILSPKLCVERKSTSDLISSLNNGRLYSQVEQMFRHYETPILLIEFDESKPFSLLPSGDMRSEISISDVASKLCLLLLHFPALKLIWSPSLSATAEIFMDLKRDQPDPRIADEESEASTNEGEGSSERRRKALGMEGGGDPVAKDVLLSLPGISPQNCYVVMRHVKNICELCRQTRGDLENLLGAENARKLYTFLHEPLRTQSSSLTTTR